MNSRLALPAALAAALAAGCSPRGSGRLAPAPSRIAAPDTASMASALARAGYAGIPMQRADGGVSVQAALGTKPVTLRLASGASFDLLLDTTLAASPGVHHTGVLSGYWTSPVSKGHWAVVDRLTVGSVPLQLLETRIEPSPVPTAPALLGALALESQGAVIDYASDTLYLPAPPGAAAPAWHPAAKQPSLRAVLEHAGQYRTFLDLAQRAGLMRLLEENTGRDPAADSIAWLGLRLPAPLLSGVAAMPPNQVHLQLTRAALDRRLRRQGRRTAFVPTDAAFARLPADTLRALRADTARLARLLRAHLLPGTAIDTADMRNFVRGVAEPDAGAAFGFQVLGPRIDVDRLTGWQEGRVAARATIVQPDLLAENGIAHGIDRVLSPALGEPAPGAALGAVLVRRGYVGIPLARRDDGNGYLVHGVVNGVSVSLTIDTGTPADLVLDRRWAEQHPATGSGYTVAFDSVGLGSVEVRTADLGESAQWTERLGYHPAVGMVGSPLLARYRAVIDCAAGMLYLRRSAAAPVKP